MKFTVNNTEYRVSWEHARKNEHFMVLDATFCYIKRDDTLVQVSDAICSKNDTFVKKYGRKLSFKRAINQLFTSKDARQKAWDAYFKIWPINKK